VQWAEAIVAAGDDSVFAFHRAYALYRSDKFDAARQTLAAAPPAVSGSEGAQHLLAQILYRSGRYAESATMYDSLLGALLAEAGGAEGDVDPSVLDDLRLNMAAAYVAAGQAPALLAHPQFAPAFEALVRGKPLRGGGFGGAAFELLYNLACALIDAGQPSAAMRALVAAYARGRDELAADGLDDARVADDLAIVRAQAAYLLQAGHYHDAAASLYADVLRAKPSDASVGAVAAVNGALLATMSGGKQLVESVRRLKATAAAPATTGKLLTRHLAALHYNAAVLSALLGQAGEADAALKRAAAALSALEAGVGAGGAGDPHGQAMGAGVDLLSRTAAALEGGATLEKAVAAVAAAGPAEGGKGGRIAGAGGAAAVSPLAALQAQAAASQGRHSEAVALLQAMGEAAGAAPVHPATVATCAHLLLVSGQGEAAERMLAASADAWQAAAGAPVPALPVFGPLDAAASLLHQRAALHLRRGDLDGAAAVFDRLHALPGLSAEHRGSALACLSVLRTRQAAAPALPEEARSRLLAGADIALREATALVVGAGGRKPSFADMSRVAEEEVSALEEAAADPLASAAAAAAAASRAAGGAAAGAGGSAAAGSAEAAAEAARVAARAAVARKRRHAKRARRREAYVAALKVRSPEFAALGVLPKPDPERWLPKRERTYGKKSRRRQIAKAAMAVTSGGAQGSAAASEAAMRELDAKAKADAAKASGKAGAGSAAGTPMTSPAGKKKPAGKGGRR
jgi:signal recognition particle subunit SRP72